MKTRLLSLSLILALFAGVGCDSNDDKEPSDADAFVGTWNVSKIRNDAGGANVDITTNIFGATGTVKDNGFVFTFRKDMTYKLMVDYKNEASTDLVVDGSAFTYALTPASGGKGILTLKLPSPTGSGVVTGQANYDITSSSTMTATVPALLMNSIFNTTLYQGNVAIEFKKQ